MWHKGDLKEPEEYSIFKPLFSHHLARAYIKYLLFKLKLQ